MRPGDARTVRCRSPPASWSSEAATEEPAARRLRDRGIVVGDKTGLAG